MAIRNRLLLPALTLSLLAAPLGALADKPKISSRDEARAADAKKKRAAEKKKREADAKKKRAAEQKKREAEQREEQRRADQQREKAEQQAEQRRAAAARAQAAIEARRQAAAEKRVEMARRAQQRRAEASALQASRREAEERARAQEKAEVRRRAAEARAADAEARQRELEARKVEAARRQAEARQAERDRRAERERAEQARRAALAEAGERRAVEAAQARDAAARAKQPVVPITAGGAPRPTPGAPLVGSEPADRGRPVRRPDDEPEGRQPIPRPDPEPERRQPIPRPDPEPEPEQRRPIPGSEPAEPPELGRRPERPLPEERGPRRADRRPPGDGRADWDDTVDRVADEAGRPPPPAPIRHPDGWDGRRDRRRRDRYDSPYADRRPYPQPYPAQPAPVEPPYPETAAEPGVGAPIGQRSDGLTAGGGPAPSPPSPPPVATGARSAPPPMLDPATETRSASDWFDGFTARGAFAGWSFQPVGDLPTGGGGARTFERYRVEGLDLYRVDAILDTRWARLQARYESNRGFGIGRDDVLLDLMVGLRAVPGLEGLSFEYLDLHFVHGRVDLVDAADGSVIETTPLKVELRTIDIAYPLGDFVTLFGRRFDSVMPRNVYLERLGSQRPIQISEQLLAVDATAYGAGLGVAKADDGEGFFGGIEGWIGIGPYDIRTVSGGLFLDGGWLTAGGVEAHAGWRQPLGAGFSVGIRDTLTVIGLDPNGLPSGMERDLAAEGLPSDDLSLQFGTVELLNGLHVDLTWSI